MFEVLFGRNCRLKELMILQKQNFCLRLTPVSTFLPEMFSFVERTRTKPVQSIVKQIPSLASFCLVCPKRGCLSLSIRLNIAWQQKGRDSILMEHPYIQHPNGHHFVAGWGGRQVFH